MFEYLTFVSTPRIETLSDPMLLRGRQLHVIKVTKRSVFKIPKHGNASITLQKRKYVCDVLRAYQAYMRVNA
jgi:hypothetical protein